MAIKTNGHPRPKIIFQESSGGCPPSNTAVFQINSYDPLKAAYAMLSSGLFTSCVFSRMGNNLDNFNVGGSIPGSFHSRCFSTNQTIETLTSFINANRRSRLTGFHCVGTIDEEICSYCLLSSEGNLNLLTVWYTTDSKELPKPIVELLDSLWDCYDELPDG